MFGMGLALLNPTKLSSLDYQSVVLADNPVAFYPMNELSGSTIFDITASPANGTATDVTLNQTALNTALGACALFNGTTSRIELPTAAKFAFSGAITTEFWIQSTDATHTGNGVSLNFNLGFRQQIVALINTIYGGALILGSPAASIATNGVYHVVCTADGSGNKIYINNVLVASNSTAWSSVANTYWTIGAANNAGSFSESLLGYISNVAIYNSVLSPTRISAHYNAGNH